MPHARDVYADPTVGLRRGAAASAAAAQPLSAPARGGRWGPGYSQDTHGVLMGYSRGTHKGSPRAAAGGVRASERAAGRASVRAGERVRACVRVWGARAPAGGGVEPALPFGRHRGRAHARSLAHPSGGVRCAACDGRGSGVGLGFRSAWGHRLAPMEAANMSADEVERAVMEGARTCARLCVHASACMQLRAGVQGRAGVWGGVQTYMYVRAARVCVRVRACVLSHGRARAVSRAIKHRGLEPVW